MPLPDANRPPPGEFCDRENQAAIGDDRGLSVLVGGEFPARTAGDLASPRGKKARRANDPDLAQDALLAAVARVSDLARVENLKAYFCRVLINEVYHLRRPSTRRSGCDERCRDIRPAAAEEAVTRLLARAWLERFRPQRVRRQQPGDVPVLVDADLGRQAQQGFGGR